MKRHLITCVLLAGLLISNVSAFAQETDKCMEKGGRTGYVAPDGTYQEVECALNTGLSMVIDYPLAIVERDLLVETTVDSFVQQTRGDFLNAFMESGAPDTMMISSWTMDVSHTEYQHSEQVFSLKFDIYTYTGGAHGLTVFSTYTFDLEKGQVLTLDDLFLPESNPLETLAPLAQAALREQLGADADIAWIDEGASPDPINYSDFVLTEDALLIFFEPYQVVAYAYGPQTVTLPLADLATILRPEYLSE